MLTVSVLGVVEAYRDDVRVELPGGKTTEVLARLALDPGRPVRVDLLLEDLWGEPTGRNTLQSKISQLRQALGDRDAVAGLERQLHPRGAAGSRGCVPGGPARRRERGGPGRG